MEYPTFSPVPANRASCEPKSSGAQSPVPMGRPRKRDLDLPPRMYRRGSSFYYVDAAGKWIPLGSDKARALHAWVDLECLPPSASVGELVRRYLTDCMDRFAPSTRSRYAAYARTLEAKFGKLPADDLTRFSLARWRDGGEVKRSWFNGCLSLLRVAYRKGGEWGWSTTNEAEGVTFNEVAGRGRYVSDVEFRAMRDQAPRWLQTAMDLSYLTGMRESDVLSLRWNAVGERLVVEQIKTGTRQAFEISPALRAVLEGAKRRAIVGLFVVATEKGRPISARRLQEAFARARDLAGVVDARFHDIRGKAATDAFEAGEDYQAMLGHSTKRMSDRYVKARRTIKAPTLKRRL
jgi:integrase